MVLTIELTPALSAKLRERAAQEGRDEAEIVRRAVEHYLQSESPTQARAGAEILAEWDAKGVLGIWQDRSDDSLESAAVFRRGAEAREQSD